LLALGPPFAADRALRCPTCREQVCCSGPVQPGQPLLTIPRQLLMTEKSAKASKHCGELVEAAGLTEWQVGSQAQGAAAIGDP
jgi:hypothetical protein